MRIVGGFSIVLALLLAAAPAARAGSTSGGVRGEVMDAEGKPLVGAEVVLVDQAFGTKYSLKTDKKGAFVQMGMKAGNYLVTITAPGFAPASAPLHVALGERTPFEVRLQKGEGGSAPVGETTSRAAYKSLERYRELRPDAPDKDQVDTTIAEARRILAAGSK